MFQPEFSLAVLKEARRRRIKCAMETCGHCRRPDLFSACEHLQILLFDIKTLDPDIHRQFTGKSNKRILENLKAVKNRFPDLPVLVRTPVIPGVNDHPEAVRAIVEFIRSMPKVQYELLPFHRLGQPKYEYLGQTFPMTGADLDEKRFKDLAKTVAKTCPHLFPPENSS